MKTILYSIFAMITLSSSVHAQGFSVTLLPTGASQCSFPISDFTQATGNGGISLGQTGKGVLLPITFTKIAGKCSSSLVIDMFKTVATVTITVGQPATPFVTYTLTNAQVTAIADSDDAKSTKGVQLETVTLSYQTIKIADLRNHTALTCSTLSNTCS